MSLVSWDELRAALRVLEARDPRPLQAYPDPGAARQRLPARIRLRPWAVEAARELYGRFGDQVALTVGFLAYPPGPHSEEGPAPRASSDPLLDPADIEVTAAGPLVVRAGEDLRTELGVTNHRSSPIFISTGASVFGRVLDPSTGAVVGGFSGAVAAVSRLFTVEPGATIAVPLVVGTASHRRSLGYAVPPGEWSVEVVLRLTDGDRRVPPLPLRVVGWG